MKALTYETDTLQQSPVNMGAIPYKDHHYRQLQLFRLYVCCTFLCNIHCCYKPYIALETPPNNWFP